VPGTNVCIPQQREDWPVAGIVTIHGHPIEYRLPASVEWRKRCPWCVTNEGKHDYPVPAHIRRVAEKTEECLLLCDSCNAFMLKWGDLSNFHGGGGCLTHAHSYRLNRWQIETNILPWVEKRKRRLR